MAVVAVAFHVCFSIVLCIAFFTGAPTCEGVYYEVKFTTGHN